MIAARLRAGLHLIYLAARLVRLECTERSGYACSESERTTLYEGPIEMAAASVVGMSACLHAEAIDRHQTQRPPVQPKAFRSLRQSS